MKIRQAFFLGLAQVVFSASKAPIRGLFVLVFGEARAICLALAGFVRG
jgi:hypothetical protein